MLDVVQEVWLRWQKTVRKIVSRARKHLGADQRETVDTVAHRQLLDAFVSAARNGDVASLEAILTPDAVSLSDGNGEANGRGGVLLYRDGRPCTFQGARRLIFGDRPPLSREFPSLPYGNFSRPELGASSFHCVRRHRRAMMKTKPSCRQDTIVIRRR